MQSLWLLDFAWPSIDTSAPALAPALGGDGHALWRSADGLLGRAYQRAEALVGTQAPEADWTELECLQSMEGPAQGGRAVCHYVVEADVAPAHEADFNAWYEQEHLPGLAGVPGTIRAARYRRLSGSPRYLACYDLLSPAGLQRPEWLAVRNTPWSGRVRPCFLNTRRTMFFRPEDAARFPQEGIASS